jgi:RND family efflux transporter MFP subunit
VLDAKSDLLKSLQIDRGGESVPMKARRRARIGVASTAAVALAVGMGAGWALKGAHVSPRPALAQTAEPPSGKSSAAREVAGELVASGYVVARREATVAAQVTGRLVEVRVEEGQRVSAGEVLAILEPNLVEADLRAAQARAEIAGADLAEAGRVLNRQQYLYNRQFASEAALTAASSRYLQAVAQHKAALSDAERAGVELSYYKIRAPFAGVVTNKTAQPGETISPTSAGGGFTRTGVCTIVDMSSLEIEVDVNEASISRVHEGQPVKAVLDAYPNESFDAHVIATIPSADRSRATVRVRIGFEHLDPRILPEMAISVRFLETRA